MLENADSLPGTYKSGVLWTSLFDGLQWLRKSVEILEPINYKKFEVCSVQKHLLLSEVSIILYSLLMNK